MKFYGKAEQVAQQIIEAFQAGRVPAALAQVYIHRDDDAPCRQWSFNNQLITALAGTSDARGFQQWKEVGRSVKKGAKAFHILAPIVRKFEDEKDGEKETRRAVIGFKSVAVFRYEDTEGEPLAGAEEAAAFVDALPFVDVARRWSLNVDTYNSIEGKALGYYRHGQAIALGVENLSVWAHELIHAAEDRLGNLTKKAGQQMDNEIVAMLGASALLEMIGRHDEADRGFTWRYIEGYAQANNREPIAAAFELTSRVAEAINLIMTEAEEIAAEVPFEV